MKLKVLIDTLLIPTLNPSLLLTHSLTKQMKSLSTKVKDLSDNFLKPENMTKDLKIYVLASTIVNLCYKQC